MALSDEQIDAVITAGVKSGAISWLGFKKDGDGRYTLPVISPSDRQQARAIEAEVRKDDEALIRQLVEALETCGDGDGYNGPYQYYATVPVEEAVAAARARLEKAP